MQTTDWLLGGLFVEDTPSGACQLQLKTLLDISAVCVLFCVCVRGVGVVGAVCVCAGVCVCMCDHEGNKMFLSCFDGFPCLSIPPSSLCLCFYSVATHAA